MTNKTLETLKSELLAEFDNLFWDGTNYLVASEKLSGQTNQEYRHKATADELKSFLSSALDRVARETAEAVIGEDELLRKNMGAREDVFLGKNVIRNKLRRQQRRKLGEWLGEGKK